MKHRSWNHVDKSVWAEGPWNDEPDKEQWIDEATSLPCLLKRQEHLGHLCGYVGVPPGHPLYGVDTDYEEMDLLVHGGVTYAAFCQEDGPECETICHTTEPGDFEPAFWIGFDCMHYRDASPQDITRGHVVGDARYRDVAYVKKECAILAGQLQAMEAPR